MNQTYPQNYGQQPQNYGYGQPSAPGGISTGMGPRFEKKSAPNCPHLVALSSGAEGETLLPLADLKVTVEIHIAVAAVRLQATFQNIFQSTKICVFQLPCSEGAATVTSTTIRVGERQYETMVVAESGAPKKKNDGLVSELEGFSGGNVGQYDPNMYRLPLNELRPGESAKFDIEYLQDLRMDPQGSYVLSVPMTIPHSMKTPQQMTGIDVVINTGTENTRWGSTSHPELEVVAQSPFRIVLKSNPARPVPNEDLVLSYSAWSDQIKGSCIMEAPSQEDPSGSFILFLSPPELRPNSEDGAWKHVWPFSSAVNGEAKQAFGRNFSFILDHSGSMYGEPMSSAKQALSTGLRGLTPNDFFSICAFDHEQIWLTMNENGQVLPSQVGQSPMLFQATPQNIETATQWVMQIEPHGLTDIKTPLQQAQQMLQARVQQEKSQGIYPRLPIAFIVTDGAVEDEKEICTWAGQNAGDVRIYTFGIGPYANRYFLKMLAKMGSGYSDICLYPDSLQQKMVSLMSSTLAPVLTKITVGLQGVQNAEIYPFPIPDLFCGAPLIVCGKYSGTFPTSVTVRGINSTGQQLDMVIPCFVKEDMPIKKIFAKMQLDYLIGEWWLADGTGQKNINEQVVESSVQHSIPCAFTQTVCYETKPTEAGEKKEKKKPDKKGKFPTGLAIGGGVVVVGAAVGLAFAFGSMSATFDGANVMDAMGAIGEGGMDILTDLGDFFQGIDVSGCCGGCNDICCFDIEGVFGDCGGCSDIFGDCGGCGDIFSGCGGCGDIFSGCGGCGDIFSGCGDIFSGCGAAVGSLGECLSSGQVCEVCGECGDICENLAGLFCGDICENLAGLF